MTGLDAQHMGIHAELASLRSQIALAPPEKRDALRAKYKAKAAELPPRPRSVALGIMEGDVVYGKNGGAQ